VLIVRNGDLFDNLKEPCIVAHGCNAQGVMGAGFATHIRKRFPGAYARYLSVSQLKVGTVNYETVGDITIANCITQEFYGKDPKIVYVDYNAVSSCLREVALTAVRLHLPIHMPLIGGGLANGDTTELFRIFAGLGKAEITLWLK
jgi:hypothetical protein